MQTSYRSDDFLPTWDRFCWLAALLSPATNQPPLLLLVHPFNGLCSRTTWVSRYQKGKTSLDLNEARDDRVLVCSGVSWTITRQITTPAPHCSIFYRPDALPEVLFMLFVWGLTNSVKALMTLQPINKSINQSFNKSINNNNNNNHLTAFDPGQPG